MKYAILLLIFGLVVVSGCGEVIPSIQDAQEEIAKAEIKIQEAEEDGKEVELAKQRLEESKLELEKAMQSLKDGDLARADELAEFSKDLAAESRMKYIGKTSEDFD